jgi:signal peptidase I
MALGTGVLVAVALSSLLFSLHLVVVRGASMEPAIALGGLEIVDTSAARPPQTGDIVVFRSPTVPGSLITHRVTGISSDGQLLTTKGDANAAPDEMPLDVEEVIGRYRGSVPFLGYVIRSIGSRWGRVLLILAPGLVIVAAEIRELARTVTRRRVPACSLGVSEAKSTMHRVRDAARQPVVPTAWLPERLSRKGSAATAFADRRAVVGRNPRSPSSAPE